MKTIFICPEHRAAGGVFQRMEPLALMPVLGRPLIALHLADAASRGVKEVLILASDRPERIRAAVGNGSAWGLTVQLVPTCTELGESEARQKFGAGESCSVHLIHALPGMGGTLWHTHADTFAKVASMLATPAVTAALTMKEAGPGIWISTQARVSKGAVLQGPVWIGPRARIAAGATLGPNVIVEERAYVDAHASLRETWIGPSTYVGSAMDFEESLAWGSTLIHLRDGAMLDVDDAFVLDDLEERRRLSEACASWPERLLALLMLVLSAPIAMFLAFRSVCCGKKSFVHSSVLLPPLRSRGVVRRTFDLAQLGTSHRYLRRWPELWQVVLGHMALVGNRPLTLREASALRGEIGQLWLSVPAGVFSLADCDGEGSEAVTASIAHAAYFAAYRCTRLRFQILRHCMRQTFTPHRPLPFSGTPQPA